MCLRLFQALLSFSSHAKLKNRIIMIDSGYILVLVWQFRVLHGRHEQKLVQNQAPLQRALTHTKSTSIIGSIEGTAYKAVIIGRPIFTGRFQSSRGTDLVTNIAGST